MLGVGRLNGMYGDGPPNGNSDENGCGMEADAPLGSPTRMDCDANGLKPLLAKRPLYCPSGESILHKQKSK